MIHPKTQPGAVAKNAAVETQAAGIEPGTLRI